MKQNITLPFLWKRIIVSGLLLSLICLPASLAAQRQSNQILGLQFSVDRLAAVDGLNAEVSVDGDVRVVAKENLNDAIVSLYFKPGGRGAKIGSDALSKFISAAIKAAKFAYVNQALPFYLDAVDLDELGARDFIEKMGQQPEGIEAFKKALNTFRDYGENFPRFKTRPHVGAVLLYAIAVGDPNWLRGNAVSWVLQFSEALKAYCTDRLARASSSENIQELNEIVTALRDCFGEEDPFYRAIRLLVERLQLVLVPEAAQQAENLYPLIEATRQDEIASRILYPLVAGKIHDIAQNALEKGNAAQTLILLSRTDLNRRTPRTHDLVRQALELRPLAEVTVLRDVETESMLNLLSSKDDRIKAAYLDFLTAQVDAALLQGDAAQAEVLLQRVIALRPDPHSDNDSLRVKQALLYLEADRRTLAIDALARVQTGISIVDRLHLGLSGLYVNRYLAVLFIVLPLATAIWFLIAELKKLRLYNSEAHKALQGFGKPQDKRTNGAAQPGASEEADRAGKMFTQSGLKKPSDPRLDEYEQCISVLGLKSSATLKEIKTTYRTLVKHIHPDTQKTDEEGIGKGRASKRFIELTQAYDRALELRRLTGLDQD